MLCSFFFLAFTHLPHMRSDRIGISPDGLETPSGTKGCQAGKLRHSEGRKT